MLAGMELNPMSLNFWIYENWTIRKARVHRGSCGFCRDGRGIHAQDSGHNGKWHGPVSDRDVAFAVARNTGQPDTRACGVCAP